MRREASWQMKRTYPCCHLLTATGRMIIVNPPLQHVPKSFTIQSIHKKFAVQLRQVIVARKGNI